VHESLRERGDAEDPRQKCHNGLKKEENVVQGWETRASPDQREGEGGGNLVAKHSRSRAQAPCKVRAPMPKRETAAPGEKGNLKRHGGGFKSYPKKLGKDAIPK